MMRLNTDIRLATQQEQMLEPQLQKQNSIRKSYRSYEMLQNVIICSYAHIYSMCKYNGEPHILLLNNSAVAVIL